MFKTLMSPVHFYLLLSTLLLVSQAAAQSAGGQYAVRKEKERLEEIERQLQNNSRNEAALHKKTKAQEKALTGLRTRLIETAQSLRAAERQANNIEARLRALEQQAANSSVDLDTQQRALSDILAALQSLELSKPPALAVSPDDAAQAARAAMTLSTAAPDLVARAATLKAEIDRIKDLSTRMDTQRAALTKTERELQARRDVIQELLDLKEAEFEADTIRIATVRMENSRLAAEATSIHEVLNELADAATFRRSHLTGEPSFQDNAPGAPTRLLPPTQLSPTPLSQPLAARPKLSAYANLPRAFSQARGLLPYPVTGRVTQRFGDPTADGYPLEGVRIQSRGGAVVTAPFSGIVAFAENLGRLGNVFILDVGQKYHVIMIGLAQLDASVGQSVSAGEPIGYMAQGAARQELYLEIRHDKEPINPDRWLASTLQ